MKPALSNLINVCQTRTENLFTRYLKELETPAPKLQEAMAYAVMNGGKRIRPLLVYATGMALGAEMEHLDSAASAVELMHSYSLIHDDLPSMDNADTRRGKPSCHKVYGEALAILAGDALQTLAFQIIIAQSDQISTSQRLALLEILSNASGIMGMAGGQALDISADDNTIEKVLTLYRLKTGALLSASVKLGMVSANLADKSIQAQLEKFAAALGLAFQLQDDLLDAESATGKPQGLDIANNKYTYATLAGADQTRKKIQELNSEAMEAITVLGSKAMILQELAEYLLVRKQ
jgi:farnesyl diphosphate synthase